MSISYIIFDQMSTVLLSLRDLYFLVRDFFQKTFKKLTDPKHLNECVFVVLCLKACSHKILKSHQSIELANNFSTPKQFTI